MRKILIIALLLVLCNTKIVRGDELHTIKATGYTAAEGNITATGTVPTAGRTLAGKREWFGATAVLWLDDGDGAIKASNYIGTYVVEDTGGKPIREGWVCDIFFDDEQTAKVWGCKNVIIQIIESEG